MSRIPTNTNAYYSTKFGRIKRHRFESSTGLCVCSHTRSVTGQLVSTQVYI